MPGKIICWTPQELIEKVIKWKVKNVCEIDGDQVWCVFDVDDFYKNDSQGLLNAIKNAQENNIKIAFANQCFELWILLHFERPTVSIQRGGQVENRIKAAYKKNKLGNFDKNQKVFIDLLSFQETAIKNAENLLPMKYEKISVSEHKLTS